MASPSGRRAAGYAASMLLVMASVSVLRLVPTVNAGAAAPVLLLAVVVVARVWGIGPALVASATASLGYSYYFLPPFGLAIENPNDWAAFVTFSITAILAGELAARAERRHLEAQEGRREIERLYQELQAAFDRTSEAEAARRNEQLKAALLDALTHNLRTPLTAIKASVTALIGSGRSESSSLSKEGRHELLEVIDEESDRLNRFIEGLSVADRPDPSQAPHFRAVALEDMVRAGLTRASTLTRDHRLLVELPPDITSLAVDPASVAEVIYILLDNASKYSPAGTTIRLLGARDDDRRARVTIIDEGPGIAPELRERVFEKFFRIPGRDPVDSRLPRGIGLGLSIARRLVEAQRGDISVGSAPSGHGTAVTMTLPLAPPARDEEPSASVAAAS